MATTLTDSKGEYLFVDLPAGVYSVTETNLAGFSDVSDVDGVNDNKVVVSLTFANLNSTENNFVDERGSVVVPAPSSGLSESPSTSPSVSTRPSFSSSSSSSSSIAVLGSISGSVLEDVDNDNDGDVGIAGVLMTLLDSTGNVVATTVTDSAGNYVFCLLYTSPSPRDLSTSRMPSSA